MLLAFCQALMAAITTFLAFYGFTVAWIYGEFLGLLSLMPLVVICDIRIYKNLTQSNIMLRARDSFYAGLASVVIFMVVPLMLFVLIPKDPASMFSPGPWFALTMAILIPLALIAMSIFEMITFTILKHWYK
jgi:hypothetical protein